MKTIESAKFRIHKIKLSMEDDGKTITLAGIKNKYLDRDKNQRTILSIFQKHNEECEKKVGVQIIYSTYERYKTCYKHTKEFLKKEYKVDDLPVSEINRRLYDRFEFYLKKDKKCCHNTVVKYIRNFNKIVRIAVEQGWLVKTPESLKVYCGYLIKGYDYLKGEGILSRCDIERESKKIKNLTPLSQSQNKLISSHWFSTRTHLVEFLHTSTYNYKVYALRIVFLEEVDSLFRQ